VNAATDASGTPAVADAVLLVSRPEATDPRWPLARVAGLPAVERTLMTLHSLGVQRVRVVCGVREFATVAAHFGARRPDRRLPLVEVVPLAPCAPTAIDAGVVRPAPALRAQLAGASPDALRRLGYAEDVTSPQGRRRAERAILQSLRQPNDGWFARTIDRSVSLAISRRLAPLPLTPNAVTLGTMVVGLAAGLLACLGTYPGFVGAGALFLLASVLDGVDGEIARMKFQQSDGGQWLDTVCDDLANVVYLAGVTVGSWRAFASPWLLQAGVAAVILDVATVSLMYWQLLTRLNARSLHAFEEKIAGPGFRANAFVRLLVRLAGSIKRDFYAPAFLLFALCGAAWIALPATAVALTVTLGFLLWDLARDAAAARRA